MDAKRNKSNVVKTDKALNELSKRAESKRNEVLKSHLESLPEAVLPTSGNPPATLTPKENHVTASGNSTPPVDNSPHNQYSVDAYSLFIKLEGLKTYKRYPYIVGNSVLEFGDLINHDKHAVDRLAVLQCGAEVVTPSKITITLTKFGTFESIASCIAVKDSGSKLWKVSGTSESGNEFTSSVKFPSGEKTTARNHVSNVVFDSLERLSVNFGSVKTTVVKIDSYVEFAKSLRTLSILHGKYEALKCDRDILNFQIEALKTGNPDKSAKLSASLPALDDKLTAMDKLIKAQIVTVKFNHGNLSPDKKAVISLESLGLPEDESLAVTTGIPTPNSTK